MSHADRYALAIQWAYKAGQSRGCARRELSYARDAQTPAERRTGALAARYWGHSAIRLKRQARELLRGAP